MNYEKSINPNQPTRVTASRSVETRLIATLLKFIANNNIEFEVELATARIGIQAIDNL